MRILLACGVLSLGAATTASADLSFDPALLDLSVTSGGAGGGARGLTPIDHTLEAKIQSTVSPDSLREDYVRLMRTRMQHEVWALRERESVYTRTNALSFLIAAFVHLVVLLGVVAAALEFVSARRARKRSQQMQEIELSLERIALKTSLHGTLLLLVSLGLYLLYLKFVYVIR